MGFFANRAKRVAQPDGIAAIKQTPDWTGKSGAKEPSWLEFRDGFASLPAPFRHTIHLLPAVTRSLKILEKISKPHWFTIIRLVKCSQGLSVNELAEAMDMSYMGVKKHCVAMHKLGFLDTWRRPKEVGRPEKTYRVTEKLDPLFPEVGNDVCLALLEAATQLDVNAAEKLLFGFYRSLTEKLAKDVVGETVNERAEKLAAARARSGYFSRLDRSGDEGSPVVAIEEFHNPLQPLFDAYPTLERMEVQMFERLLGVRIERRYRKVSGLREYRFEFS